MTKKLIILEGNEGSGKTYLANLLVTALYAQGLKVCKTGAWTNDSVLATAVRKYLLTEGKTTGDPVLDASLVLSAINANMHESVLRAFYQDTDVVVMDRGYVSFVVRQLMMGTPEVNAALTPLFQVTSNAVAMALADIGVEVTHCYVMNTPENCIENLKARGKNNAYNERYLENMAIVHKHTNTVFAEQANLGLQTNVVQFANYTDTSPVAPPEAVFFFINQLINPKAST